MVKPWPIEIDGLPNLRIGGFSMAMLNNQMVPSGKLTVCELENHYLRYISYFYGPFSEGKSKNELGKVGSAESRKPWNSKTRNVDVAKSQVCHSVSFS